MYFFSSNLGFGVLYTLQNGLTLIFLLIQAPLVYMSGVPRTSFPKAVVLYWGSYMHMDIQLADTHVDYTGGWPIHFVETFIKREGAVITLYSSKRQ